MSNIAVFAALVAAGLGYWTGIVHGEDRASLAADRAAQVIVADYPFANVCSEMLEAAWSIGAGTIPPDLPHNP